MKWQNSLLSSEKSMKILQNLIEVANVVHVHAFLCVLVPVHKAVSIHSTEYAIRNLNLNQSVMNNPVPGNNNRETQRPIVKCGKRFWSFNSGRLFITLDRNTKISFLFDKLICVYPRKFIRSPLSKSDYELSAVNGTIIKTYDTILLTLNFGLQHDFT